jgi:hypothetical protein
LEPASWRQQWQVRDSGLQVDKEVTMVLKWSHIIELQWRLDREAHKRRVSKPPCYTPPDVQWLEKQKKKKSAKKIKTSRKIKEPLGWITKQVNRRSRKYGTKRGDSD